MTKDEQIMKNLIDYGYQQMKKLDAYPFCAAIVKDGVIISRGYAMISTYGDKTTHGEMVAMRRASRALSRGIDLKGYSIYSNCECCLACFDAALWAGIRSFVFATDHTDFPEYFHDHPYQIDDYIKDNPGEINVIKGVLREEARELFMTAKKKYGW